MGIFLKKQVNFKLVWRIFTILWVVFIFSNSAQPASVSSEISGGLWEFLDELFGTFWLSEHLLRKCAHLFEYAVLGGLLLFSVQIDPPVRPKWGLICLAIGVVVASLDETLQLFVEGRSGQVSDVLVDAVGVTIGILCAILCLKGKEKWKISQKCS